MNLFRLMNVFRRLCAGRGAPSVLLAVVVFAMLNTSALADETRKLPKISELWFQDQQGAAQYQQTFRNTLRDLGHVDGKSAIFIARFANGDAARLPALLTELLAQRLDVLWVSPRALPAAKQAKSTTPIVSVFFDPMAEGIAKSLAKPLGNITGMSWQTVETSGKRLQYTKEFLPNLNRIALLYDATDPGAALDARALREAANTLKLAVNELQFRNAKELEVAFDAIKRGQPQAIIVVHSPLSVHYRSEIVRLAAGARLPFISEGGDFAEAGALLSYGPSVIDMFERSALYAHKILKGAKPRDLPIEQPTVFQLIVNQKTAKALGIKIPEAILLQADEVIR
jgi:putative tryptophan/tyrosine transport system substrate-binding protein